ncbi:uncharacterized protein [Diadema setosum]|uniref:uncharacterized protein n=1 Tax=Diadema setosum TaxID=31175 RepID=UPI003B3BE7E6
MDDFSILKGNSSINPWASDVNSTSATASIIRYSEKSGYLRLKRDEDVQEVMETLQRQSTSLKLIHRLKEIAEKTRQLSQVNVEIQCHLMDKETRDLTHLNLLDAKIVNLSSISGHLQRAIQQKKELINRLQQPLVGDFLRVEASYHAQVKELFPLLVACLGELSANLENVQWGSGFDLSDGRMVEVLGDIETRIAQLQTALQTITQVRQSVAEM